MQDLDITIRNVDCAVNVRVSFRETKYCKKVEGNNTG